MKDSAITAKKASYQMASLKRKDKDRALMAIDKALKTEKSQIFEANRKDIKNAEKNNLPSPILKRLKFDEDKLSGISEGIYSTINLEDPSGRILKKTELDEKLILNQVSCPIGVIGMIFESRPDALIQIATLCLKSGNSVLLKGGSEARETNRVLWKVIKEASEAAGIPEGWIQLMESRDDVNEILELDEYINLLIPRGSNEFVKYIMDNTHIPVMGHADGICHTYIHHDADIEMAVNVAFDAKTQYVSVCNATETILVHKDRAKTLLPLLKKKLDEKSVIIHGCQKTGCIIDCLEATVEDWATEYLDYAVSIKIVENMEEAMEHINNFGSGHTDAIISCDRTTAEFFMDRIDSADVLWNCSTRFADGFRYGLGAEVGVSTSKIHSRGPVGLEGLVIYKWKLYGNGQTVEEYSNGTRKFTHKQL